MECFDRDIWNLVPLYLMWCKWRECNRCAFEDVDSSENQLLAILVVIGLIVLSLGHSHLVAPSFCSLVLLIGFLFIFFLFHYYLFLYFFFLYF